MAATCGATGVSALSLSHAGDSAELQPRSMLPIVYTAVILSALTVGGLASLRSIRNVVVRAITFVLLCFVVMRVSFGLSYRWNLDAVQAGAAWGVVLLTVVIVEVIRRTKKR
jgi:hypothetical protein